VYKDGTRKHTENCQVIGKKRREREKERNRGGESD
jgi:hypothetical protein